MTTEFVPVCGELLWVDLYTITCSSFCMLSLAETIVVLMLAYHEERFLFPHWLVELISFASKSSMSEEADSHCCAAVICCTALRAAGPRSRPDDEAPNDVWSTVPSAASDSTTRRLSNVSSAGTLEARIQHAHGTAHWIDVANRLCSFEKLFFTLDVKSKGWLTTDEVGLGDSL